MNPKFLECEFELAMKRILVVDDEKDIAILLQAILQSAGFRVKAVTSFKAALAELHCSPYDVIFLDVNIGSENGLSLVPMIRRRHPDAEIVVITAQNLHEIFELSTAVDIKKFISKPFNKADILKAV